MNAVFEPVTDIAQAGDAAASLRTLINVGADQLPMPGSGQTLQRWQRLGEVAARDLSLLKLYEGHTDALAILAELNAMSLHRQGLAWAVWAAEAPRARVMIKRDATGAIRLHGRKAWCSGASAVDRGLLTAWDPAWSQPLLVAVDMHQDGIRVDEGPWQAVGMAGSASADVHFDNATAIAVGNVGDYLTRPGFWHGGAGIAACWYGAAAALASHVADPLLDAHAGQGAMSTAAAQVEALRSASVGRLDVALSGARAVLRDAAAWIDAQPRADAMAVALRCRLVAEQCAQQVLAECGRLAGAAPYCRDRWFAQMAADLPVFVRQSHADRDLAALGRLRTGADSWAL